MILLITFSLLFSFFFVKDQIASFQLLKEIFVFWTIIYFTDCVIVTEFELQPVSLNVKHELRSKRVKTFCQLFCVM